MLEQGRVLIRLVLVHAHIVVHDTRSVAEALVLGGTYSLATIRVTPISSS